MRLTIAAYSVMFKREGHSYEGSFVLWGDGDIHADGWLRFSGDRVTEPGHQGGSTKRCD